MDKGKFMSPTELRLYKEKIIRDYRVRVEATKHKNHMVNLVLKRLRTIVPLNIALGIIASALLVYLKGWDVLLQVFLTSVVWITLASTIISAIIGKKS